MSKTTIPTGGITDGTIVSGDLADDAVTATKIADAVGLGKIGQVIQTAKTDTSAITSASYTEFDSNFRCAITPSATSSKILVTLHLVVGGDGNTMHTA